MTIDEVIKTAQAVVDACDEENKHKEHHQNLVNWLMELKRLRLENETLERENKNLLIALGAY